VVKTTLLTPIGSLRVPIPLLPITETVIYSDLDGDSGFCRNVVTYQSTRLHISEGVVPYFIVTFLRNSDLTKNDRKKKQKSKEESRKYDKEKGRKWIKI
jgi:hypothetical protein